MAAIRARRDWAHRSWVPHISRQAGRWTVEWFPLLDAKVQEQVRQAIAWAKARNQEGREAARPLRPPEVNGRRS